MDALFTRQRDEEEKRLGAEPQATFARGTIGGDESEQPAGTQPAERFSDLGQRVERMLDELKHRHHIAITRRAALLRERATTRRNAEAFRDEPHRVRSDVEAGDGGAQRAHHAGLLPEPAPDVQHPHPLPAPDQRADLPQRVVGCSPHWRTCQQVARQFAGETPRLRAAPIARVILIEHRSRQQQRNIETPASRALRHCQAIRSQQRRCPLPSAEGTGARRGWEWLPLRHSVCRARKRSQPLH